MDRLSFLRTLIGIPAVAAAMPAIEESLERVLSEINFNFYPSCDVIITEQSKFYRIGIPFNLRPNSYIPQLGSIIVDLKNKLEYCVVFVDTHQQFIELMPVQVGYAKSFYKDGSYIIMSPISRK